MLEDVVASELAVNLGWMLVHSLWQIAAVAFLLFVGLRSSREPETFDDTGPSLCYTACSLPFA